MNLIGHGLAKNFLSAHEPYNQQRKFKRKHIRTEAERACAKEAAASRLALEALRKELATAPQVNSFVIEESCTETTVENFIPHTEESFMDNLNEMQVVNYADLNGGVFGAAGHLVNVEKQFAGGQIMHFNATGSEGQNEKIKHILGNDLPGNVEIMFKTSDGNFVSVTDEMLQNITKGALQYQVIDENGQAGEIQELHVLDKAVIDTPVPVTEPNASALTASGYDDTYSSYVTDDSKLLLTSLNDPSAIGSLEVNPSTSEEKDSNKLGEPLLNLYNEGLYFNLKPPETSSDEVPTKKQDIDAPETYVGGSSDCFVDLVLT